MSQVDAWTLPGPSALCARCQAELVSGTQVTVLLSLAADGPTREDLCTSCAAQVDEQAGAFFWRRKCADAGEAGPVVDYAFLREMFERMLGRPEPVYRRLAYLVGLVLVRKRHLRLKSFESRHGREVMLVSRGAGQPDLEVPAPHLSADDMLQTREQLKRLLAADIPESGEELLLDGGDEQGQSQPGPAPDDAPTSSEQRTVQPPAGVSRGTDLVEGVDAEDPQAGLN